MSTTATAPTTSDGPVAPSTPIAYATPGNGPNPTWRLATLVVGGLGFTFCGGCFCIGLLFLLTAVPQINAGQMPGAMMPLTAGQAALACVLAAMAIVCFVTAIALILRAFRFDRATQ